MSAQTRVAFRRAAGVVALAACSSALRTPPLGPHPSGAEPVVVEEAPPPAKIETIPRDPGAPCVWLDGRWEWFGRRWEWTPGGWVDPPDGCYFAPPLSLWVPAEGRGQLFYMPGRWYPRGGGRCPEPRLCK